jgi:class III poly(R)-hydroxyalkanoic acid synthase PhaE subunit
MPRNAVEDAGMSDQANDVMKQYQAWAQQSWDAWMQSLQAPMATSTAAASSDDLLSRALGGLKSYADWLHAAATSGIAGQGQEDWQQHLRQLFTGASQPFAQAFAGIDGAALHGFAQQWQSWLQAAQPRFGEWGSLLDNGPAFGYTRERQLQNQALLEAMREYADASARYQALIQRANAEGFERLQDKLKQHVEPGRQVDSLKALYDLWVDAAEEAYADIALSDEFRDVYGAMVNAQMHVRKLQQRQLDAWCREVGMPTRSEVESLGKRVQELRRELRAMSGDKGQRPSPSDGELEALRAEVAALKRKLATRAESAPAAKKVVSESLSAEAEAKRKPAPARRAAKNAPARSAPRQRK